MFFSANIFTNIATVICPTFLTFTMLKIIFPTSWVTCAVYMNVKAFSVCFIVYPITFIYISINMHKFTKTVCSAVFPLPIINSTIWPNLFALSITEASSPFTLIFCTRFISILSNFFLSVWVKLFVSNCFLSIILCEISGISFSCLLNLSNF